MDDFLRNLWKKQSAFSIRGILDFADVKGFKNRYIDFVQKATIKKNVKFLRGDRVLDFGCGPGRLSSWVAGFKVKEVIGLDITAEMLKKAKSNYFMKRNLRFTGYGGDKVPFPGAYFDKILSVWVFQHIIDNNSFEGTIREISRVLREGGVLFFIEQISGDTIPEKYPGTENIYKVYRRVDEYISYLEKNGFKLMRSCFINARNGPFYNRFITGRARCLMNSLLLPVGARFDLYWTRNKKLPKKGYVDCLFVFEKK